MATAEATPVSRQQHIVLDYISWSTYERLLQDLGQTPIQLTYDKGRLEIMPPLPIHEIWKKHIARLIETMATQRRFRIKALGSTTFNREDVEQGLEPDECYYVTNLARIQGKARLDLTTDPPPDLAIEVDITHRSVPRQPIYAGLGIPELWRFDGSKLQVLKLGADKTYKPVSRSEVFPFLAMDRFESFVFRMESTEDLEAMDEFQVWVKSL